MYNISNLGLTMPGQQKAIGYFTSVGTSLGYGERSDPINKETSNVPGVGNYDVANDAGVNENPKYGFGTSKRPFIKASAWPGPGGTEVIEQPKKTKHGYIYTNGRVSTLPKKEKEGDEKKNDGRDKDGLGPGQYTIANPNAGPKFSFGSRFNSSIRNKDHLRPRKVDGPGPGAYKMPSSVKTGKRTDSHMDALKKSTFGNGVRNFSNLPKDTPAPGRYDVNRFTEAAHSFSFPKDGIKQAMRDAKDITPAPNTYTLSHLDMAKQRHQEKSIAPLPSKDPKEDDGNFVPGPGTYKSFHNDNPAGTIKIMKNVGESKANNEYQKDPVGPQKYYPVNPCHNAKPHMFGTSLRPDLVKSTITPGPGEHTIKSVFENAKENPKFHMGQKLQGFAGKNMDQPGPGEYETDVIPIHHSHIAHFIGTSFRSDLGVGKAYMYPGPGDYEAQVDSNMDPRIRIAGTFGTEKKDTVIKKTFAPGPGSYDLPNSTGLMPQYLRTEENRRIKEQQEAALRARLEI